MSNKTQFSPYLSSCFHLSGSWYGSFLQTFSWRCLHMFNTVTGAPDPCVNFRFFASNSNSSRGSCFIMIFVGRLVLGRRHCYSYHRFNLFGVSAFWTRYKTGRRLTMTKPPTRVITTSNILLAYFLSSCPVVFTKVIW